MLYLEDYVELIEHLPVDLRDRFTDMREMDLQVQNTMDSLHDRVKNLFQACNQKKGKVDKADEIFKEIQAEYYKALEDADEKVHLTNQIYDLVDRHLRKLDQELAKFKMELEADNAGITEILERKSLDLDNPSNNNPHSSHVNKRKHTSHANAAQSSASQPHNGPIEKKHKTESSSGMLRSESLPADLYLLNKAHNLGSESESNSSRPPSRNSATSSSTNNNLQMTGVQLAAAQAVQATASMHGGRRTASMKASYEALKNSDFPTKVEHIEDEIDMSDHRVDVISEEMGGSDNSVTSPTSLNISRPSRTKKPTSRAAQWTQERMQAEARRGQREKDQHPDSVDPLNDSTASEWTCDPNEPRYCLCNQVSYGEMVGCDNEKCTIEWFHYGCVGLSEAPKGKWYCPQCTQSMKRRNKNKS